MKRRSFLKLLGAAPVVAACPSLAGESVKRKHFTREQYRLIDPKTDLTLSDKFQGTVIPSEVVWSGDLLTLDSDGCVKPASIGDNIAGVAANSGNPYSIIYMYSI